LLLCVADADANAGDDHSLCMDYNIIIFCTPQRFDPDFLALCVDDDDVILMMVISVWAVWAVQDDNFSASKENVRKRNLQLRLWYRTRIVFRVSLTSHLLFVRVFLVAPRFLQA
jgi:hypothetical protein